MKLFSLRPAAQLVLAATVFSLGAVQARPVFAQDAKPAVKADDTAYTLKKRVFKTGDINRYKLVMQIQASTPMGDVNTTFNMTFKETTKEAKPTGELTIVDEFETASANVGGQEMDVTSFLPTVTLSRDKAGKFTTKTDGGNEQGNAQIAGMMQQFASSQDNVLPTKPVKVGDKWKLDSTEKTPLGENKVKGDAEAVATETINSIKTLKIKVVATVTSSGADEASKTEGKTEAVVNIDPDTGRIIRMTQKNDAMVQGNKMKQDIEMTLLSKEDKAK